MDWDEPRARPAKSMILGEPLDTHSIAELQERITALEAEIVRTHAEIDRKRKQAEAASALFR